MDLIKYLRRMISLRFHNIRSILILFGLFAMQLGTIAQTCEDLVKAHPQMVTSRSTKFYSNMQYRHVFKFANLRGQSYLAYSMQNRSSGILEDVAYEALRNTLDARVELEFQNGEKLTLDFMEDQAKSETDFLGSHLYYYLPVTLDELTLFFSHNIVKCRVMRVHRQRMDDFETNKWKKVAVENAREIRQLSACFVKAAKKVSVTVEGQGE